MKAEKTSIVYVLLNIFLVAIFPICFLYLNNFEEVSLREIYIPIIIFALPPIILFCVLKKLWGSTLKAALSSIITVITFSNFRFFEIILQKLAPQAMYWHALIIMCFLLLHIYYFIYKFATKDFLDNFLKIILIVTGMLLLFNLILAVPNIINKIKFSTNQNIGHMIVENTIIEDKPNVYYLLFDEYAGFEQIEKYYNYDNKELEDFFISNNFNYSINSHNSSANTSIVMTNIVNLDIVSYEQMPVSERDVLRHNGILFDIFRKNGYNIDIVTNESFYRVENTKSLDRGNATIDGVSFYSLVFSQTILYPFQERLDSQFQVIMGSINYMLDPKNIKKEPTLVWFHIDLPHEPFWVDEYGNRLPSKHHADWENDKYYLGQYKYATKIMMDIVNVIRGNDPDAIIIIQSDHGARASSNPELVNKKFPVEDMTNIVNAVYYKGEIIDIKGKSGIDTVRIVLNHLFGMNLDMVEETHNEIN